MPMKHKDKLIRGPWTKGDLRELKKHFPNEPTAKTACRLNRPEDTVRKKASRLGLKKSRKYMKALGRL